MPVSLSQSSIEHRCTFRPRRVLNPFTNWFSCPCSTHVPAGERLSQGERSLPRVSAVGTVAVRLPAGAAPSHRAAQQRSRAPRLGSFPPRSTCSKVGPAARRLLASFQVEESGTQPITFGGLEIPRYRRKIPPLRPVPLPRFQSGLLRLSRHAAVPAAARGATRAAAFLEILYRRGRT